MPSDKHIHVNWDSQQQVDFLMRRVTDMGFQIVSDAFGSMGADVWIPDFWDDKFVYNNGLVLDQNEHNSDLTIDTSILLAFSGNSDWEIACGEMAKWYMENIHTYQGDESGHATGNRKGYECDLFKNDSGKPTNFKVFDDCTCFVTACLLYLAWKKDKMIFDKYKDKAAIYSSMSFYNTDNPSDAQALLKDLGFEWVEVDPADTESGKAYETKLVKGDIICVNQQHSMCKSKTGGASYEGQKYQHHGEIYWGVDEPVQRNGRDITPPYNHKGEFTKKFCTSLGWGAIHDNQNNHYGMPSPTVPYKYDACWHYVG